MTTINALRPLHKSMLGSQMWSRVPPRMSAISMEDETKVALTEIALSIFTDCVNSGKTFQDAILAVYISGVQNAAEAAKNLS